MKRWSAPSSLLVFLLAAPAAQAAHPLITEDTGTLGTGGWQLEVNAERAQSPGVGATIWGTTISYGFAETADVLISPSYISGEGKTDTLLGVKWRFYKQDLLSFGVRPGLLLPTGNEDRGLGSGHLGWNVPLFLSYQPERWAFHAQVAYLHESKATFRRETVWQGSASLWLKPTPELKLVSDLSYATHPDPSVHHTIRHTILGAIYSVTKSFDVDAGYRKGNGFVFDHAWMAGITVRW